MFLMTENLLIFYLNLNYMQNCILIIWKTMPYFYLNSVIHVNLIFLR